MASRFVNNIAKRFKPLTIYPELGASREEFYSGMRVCLYRGYAIYYRFSAAHVIIMRVLHGARDAQAMLALEGEE